MLYINFPSLLEISQWPDTKVFSLSAICRSAVPETTSPFPPSRKMSHLQQQLHIFFRALPSSRPKVSALPRLLLLCSHQFKMCNFHAHLCWAQWNFNPQDSRGMGRSSLLTLFQSQVDWKIRSKKERLIRQNNKKILAFSPSFLFPHLTGSGEISWNILLWGSECNITCTSFCCSQRNVHVIFDIWACSVNRFRSPQCSSEETICCESSEQRRLCVCYTLCSLNSPVSDNKGIFTCTSWTHFLETHL